LPSPLPEVGKFTAGPPGTADAVLASDNDNPAAPNTGRALLRRFCFEVCFAWGIDKLLLLSAASRSYAAHNSSKPIRGPSDRYFRNFLTKPVVHDRRTVTGFQVVGDAGARTACIASKTSTSGSSKKESPDEGDPAGASCLWTDPMPARGQSLD